VEALAKSIKEFGFRQPIVVDSACVIVVGHTRFKAALKLGLKTVPVHVAADFSPQQARASRVADNRTAETGARCRGLRSEAQQPRIGTLCQNQGSIVHGFGWRPAILVVLDGTR